MTGPVLSGLTAVLPVATVVTPPQARGVTGACAKANDGNSKIEATSSTKRKTSTLLNVFGLERHDARTATLAASLDTPAKLRPAQVALYVIIVS